MKKLFFALGVAMVTGILSMSTAHSVAIYHDGPDPMGTPVNAFYHDGPDPWGAPAYAIFLDGPGPKSIPQNLTQNTLAT